MNQQERQLVEDLFDRLSQLENAPRDRDANDVIQQGLRRAPNALYPLVQTVLLQDEALRRANARIEELEALTRHESEQPQQGGFLDSMRGALFGGGQLARTGSVPNVRPGDSGRPQWNDMRDARGGTGFNVPPPGPGAPPPAAGGGGGSFLGTAAAAAAGMVGGSLLMNSIGGLMGGNKHGFGDQSAMGKADGKSESANPWSGGDQGKDDLSRDAGLNDIGQGRGSDGGDSRQGFADHASYDDENNDDFDDGDFDGGDSDFA